ncbi:MAG: hypothetical protein AAFN93_25690 [Bacteroidota bacterium]
MADFNIEELEDSTVIVQGDNTVVLPVEKIVIDRKVLEDMIEKAKQFRESMYDDLEVLYDTVLVITKGEITDKSKVMKNILGFFMSGAKGIDMDRLVNAFEKHFLVIKERKDGKEEV